MSVAKRDGACILMWFLTKLDCDLLELASLAFLLCLVFQVTVATGQHQSLILTADDRMSV